MPDFKRWYFPSSGAAAVSPAYAAWDDSAQAAARLKCVRTRISSAMAGVSIIDGLGSINTKFLWRQYVSDPIGAQTISGTVKGQLRVYQEDALCNHDQVCLCIKVVSNDGTTLRGTLLALGAYMTANSYALVGTNRKMADGDALSSVVAQDGDRLVIEVGTRPSTVPLTTDLSIIAIFGDNNATDLPENETDATSKNSWLEFSGDILPAATTVALEAGSAASAGLDVTAEPGPLEVALESGAATATGNDAGTSLGGIETALESGAATAAGNEVSPMGGDLSIPLEAGAAVSVGYDLVTESRWDYPNPGPTGASDAVVPIPIALANIGVRTTGYLLRNVNSPTYSPVGTTAYYRKLGSPYFAMVSKTPGSIMAGYNEDTFSMDLAVYGLPNKLASDDEHHIVVEHYAVGGPTAFYIAVTPNGRLVFFAGATAAFVSNPGLVVADGQYRAIVMQLLGGGEGGNFYYDGTLIFNAAGLYDTARIAALANQPGEFMFFNGRTGLTRFPMGIRDARLSPEGRSQVAWYFNEGVGLEVDDYENVNDGLGGPNEWKNRDDIYVPPPAYPGTYPAYVSDFTGDHTLVAQFIDPTIYGYTRVWGSLLNTNVRQAFAWDHPTGFSKRVLTTPTYAPMSVATEYRRR